MRVSCFVMMAAALPCTALAQTPIPPTQPSPYVWKVENRFRLWTSAQPESGAALERLYPELVGAPDAGKAHDTITAFLSTHPAIAGSLPWDAASDSYRAAYIFPKSYKVTIGLAEAATLAGASCKWSTSQGHLVQTQLPCVNSTALELPADPAVGSVPVDVTVTIRLNDGSSRSVTDTIQVHDRLIVSLGDSFASGEGNPDTPSKLTSLGQYQGAGWDKGWEQTWLGRSPMDGVAGAKWSDPVCHRSLYNQHLVAALKLAADRPHDAVTFLSYACSGAGVFDGLLAPQDQPPGYRDSASAKNPALAQVEAMARDLCLPADGGAPTPEERKYNQPVVTRFLGVPHVTTKPISVQSYTCSAGRRKPNAILLSIGGNDVYFGPIIMGAMLPQHADDLLSEATLQLIRDKLAKDPADSVAALTHVLRPELEKLSDRLSQVAPNVPIFQSSYPSPIRDGAGAKCGPVKDPGKKDPTVPVLRRLVAPNGLWPELLPFVGKGWIMSISQRDGTDVEAPVVGGLNGLIEQNASEKNWVFVQSYRDAIGLHGWCAGDAVLDQADLPIWDDVGKSWTPWQPSNWEPYKQRDRYFRTPNDAALTEIQTDARQGLGLQKRQWLLLNALSGAFHPTFQAHVVMGLDVARFLEAGLPGQ